MKGVAACLVLLALATGCSSPQSKPDSITVFAAASLKTVFTELGARFEKDHPEAAVEFSFAGSSDLATQLTQGAPADVFASADTRNMDKVARAGLLAGDPVDFASNTLTIVVAPGNPKSVSTFRDLAKPDLGVVVCAPQVPCGAATQKVAQAIGVDVSPVSEESSVTDVLNKVTSGQADAGVVYLTDARDAGDKVATVAFPEAAEAVNTYPIAVLEQSRNPGIAAEFAALVTGDVGREVLGAAGFGPP